MSPIEPATIVVAHWICHRGMHAPWIRCGRRPVSVADPRSAWDLEPLGDDWVKGALDLPGGGCKHHQGRCLSAVEGPTIVAPNTPLGDALDPPPLHPLHELWIHWKVATERGPWAQSPLPRTSPWDGPHSPPPCTIWSVGSKPQCHGGGRKGGSTRRKGGREHWREPHGAYLHRVRTRGVSMATKMGEKWRERERERERGSTTTLCSSTIKKSTGRVVLETKNLNPWPFGNLLTQASWRSDTSNDHMLLRTYVRIGQRFNLLCDVRTTTHFHGVETTCTS